MMQQKLAFTVYLVQQCHKVKKMSKTAKQLVQMSIQFHFPTYVMVMMSLLQAQISPSIFVVRMMNDGGRTGGQWGAGCFIAPLMNKDDTIWANGAPDQES